jgi:hypothetical protein
MKAKNTTELLKQSSNFSTPKKNNLLPYAMPSHIAEEIENNGLTLEKADELSEAGIPVLKYKTQLTIHGEYELKKSGRVGGYKNLFLNDNKSLGVRYSALDLQKKKKIRSMANNILHYSKKLNIEVLQFHAAIFSDSSGHTKLTYADYFNPSNGISESDWYSLNVDKLNNLRKGFNAEFVGTLNAYLGVSQFLGKAFYIEFDVLAIYEKNVDKFLQQAYCITESEYELIVDSVRVEREAQEKLNAEKMAKLNEEFHSLKNEPITVIDGDIYFNYSVYELHDFDKLVLLQPYKPSENCSEIQFNLIVYKKTEDGIVFKRTRFIGKKEIKSVIEFHFSIKQEWIKAEEHPSRHFGKQILFRVFE